MRRTKFSGVLCACILLAICLVSRTATAELLYTYAPGLGGDNLGPLVAGTEFTVGTNPVTLTRLGVVDIGRDGLNAAHDVGVWDAGGSLLASVTVPAGGGDLIEDWRFVDLAIPLTLAANSSYRIAANWATGDPPGDDFNAFNRGFVTPGLGPGIASLTPGAVYAYSSTLTYPNFSNDPNTRFNANAVLAVAVPEPTSMLVWSVLGLAALSRMRRRRHKVMHEM